MAGRQADWMDIGLKTWLLGFEAAQVVWLRGGVIAMGGARGEREARRMIDEKVAANTEFCLTVATGGAGHSPEAVGRKALRHYGGRVRANGRRLKRP